MLTDREIKIRGVEALHEALGDLDAERFIALTIRDAVDYTEWQRELFSDLTTEEISAEAMRLRLGERASGSGQEAP